MYIGFPRDAAFAKANQTDARGVAGFVLVVGLAILATRLTSNLLVVRPVTALATTTKCLGAGDRSARTGLAHTRWKFGQLARAIDELATSLEAQEAGGPPPPKSPG